jgi:hypothetical protein
MLPCTRGSPGTTRFEGGCPGTGTRLSHLAVKNAHSPGAPKVAGGAPHQNNALTPLNFSTISSHNGGLPRGLAMVVKNVGWGCCGVYHSEVPLDNLMF